MRALPGGMTILGLFIVSATDPFQNTVLNSRLRKLLTSIDVAIGKSSLTVRQQLTCERIVLHICNTTLKYNNFSIAILKTFIIYIFSFKIDTTAKHLISAAQLLPLSLQNGNLLMLLALLGLNCNAL